MLLTGDDIQINRCHFYNTVHKKKKNMSSLSPNEDARRMSPRKSARQRPHYLARESNEQKGGKGGKKLGGGVK